MGLFGGPCWGFGTHSLTYSLKQACFDFQSFKRLNFFVKDPSVPTSTSTTAEPKMGPLELFWLGKISVEEFHSSHSGNSSNGGQKQERNGELAASSLGKQAADPSSKPFHEQEAATTEAATSSMAAPASSSMEAATCSSATPATGSSSPLAAADGSSPSQAIAPGRGNSAISDPCPEASTEASTLSKRARFRLEKGYDKPRAGKCQDYYAWYWQRPKNKQGDRKSVV